MKKMSLFIIYFLLLACGSEPGGLSEEALKGSSGDKSEIYKKLTSEISSLELKCTESKCPENVVLLGVIEGGTGELRYCNGLHLGNGRVLSVSSCLPITISESHGVGICSENVVLRHSGSDKVFECLKVESTSIERNFEEERAESWTRDYIVLTFEGLDLSSAPSISKNQGLSARHYDVWGFDVNLDRKLASKNKHKCMISYGNYLQPLGNHFYSPNLSLTRCDDGEYFLSANSAGSIISMEGVERDFHYLGMYMAPISNELLSEVTELESIFRRDSQVFANDLGGFAINFSCWASLYKDPVEIPRECFSEKLSSRQDDINFERDNMLDIAIGDPVKFEKTIQMYRDLYESEDEYAQWEARVSFENLKYKVHPDFRCFQNIDKWLHKISTKTFVYNETLSSIELKPRFNYEFKIDSSETITERAFKIEFSAKDLKKKKRADVSITEITPGSGATVENYRLEDVEACP